MRYDIATNNNQYNTRTTYTIKPTTIVLTQIGH